MRESNQKPKVMAALDSSWNLEQRLKDIVCSDDLKAEILKFIEKNHNKCTGKAMSFSNIYYRGNLHYIEDNINKNGLIDELRTYNCA
jgi:hypothetical protein